MNKDNTPLKFGKYKGMTPLQISSVNPGYLTWMWEHFDNPPFSKKLYEQACEAEMEDQEYDDFEMDLFADIHDNY